MVKRFLDHLTLLLVYGLVRPNSDFMILDTWMSILRNFRISCSKSLVSASLNNQRIKLPI